MAQNGYKNKLNLLKTGMPLISNFLNLGFIQVSSAVIQILLFPIILRITGLEKFGLIMVTNSVASLAGLAVNYGTSLSGIKDVSINKNDTTVLARIVYSIFFTRLSLAILCFCCIPVLYLAHFNITYLFCALPIVLTEIVNPLFFFTGTEKLFSYNLANLLSKLFAAVLIILFIKTPDQAPFVNFYLGICSLFFYILLSIYLVYKFNLGKIQFQISAIISLLKQNFYLFGNNVSVQLQQSFFLFTINATDNPLLLGAYSLCDKIVWSFRLLISAFSGAIFPKAVRTYTENESNWLSYKKKMNQYLAIFFIMAGLGLLITAPYIPKILTGKNNLLTTSFIQAISFVPFVVSMNVLNVLDLLIRNQYQYIFKIAMILLCITILVSFSLVKFGSVRYFGFYPLIIDTCAIQLYLYFINKTSKRLL